MHVNPPLTIATKRQRHGGKRQAGPGKRLGRPAKADKLVLVSGAIRPDQVEKLKRSYTGKSFGAMLRNVIDAAPEIVKEQTT